VTTQVLLLCLLDKVSIFASAVVRRVILSLAVGVNV
jgi:hypothetical protein